MPDLTNWVAGATAVKAAFDTLKSAIGLLKDAKELLPEGDQRARAISLALDSASQSAKIAEAEVAKALGYQLCKCQFPPTPMLTVGYHIRHDVAAAGSPVFECPECGITSAGPFMYERTAPEREKPPTEAAPS